MGVLRLLLALAVYFYHAGNVSLSGIHLLHGGTAVYCFFVISGFYMEMILTQKYNPNRLGSAHVRMFYLARFWRLYPTYFLIGAAVLILSTATNLVQLPPTLDFRHAEGTIATIRSIGTWIMNITGAFLNVPPSQDLLIGPGWSLGIEASFYAIAPFCVRLKPAPLIGLSLIACVLQFIPYGTHSPVLYGFHLFLLGGLAFRYRVNIESTISRIFGSPPLFHLYILIFLIVSISIPHEIHLGRARDHAANTVDCFLYPVIVAALIPLLHERTKANRLDEWIGHLSYPIYLVHQLIIDLFSSWDCALKTEIVLLVIFFISAILVQLEAHFVEPWRSRFANRS
jgi:peptidoglycan/LPS O-acetylase OafA/YrhL